MSNIEDNNIYKFRRLYESNFFRLTQFASRFTSDGIAKDIVQDVFLELWRTDKTLDDQTSKSYLFTAVRNRCINYIKQQQVKNIYLDQSQADLQIQQLHFLDSIEKAIINTEQLQQIYDLIEQLPEKCRQIFKLSYFEEKKSPEIAEMLQISIRTVEHQLYLGLKTLRTKLLVRYHK